MSLATLVQALTEFAEDCETDFDKRESDDPAALAVVLAAVREARAGLAEFAAEVERVLLAEMGEKAIEVEGLGLVEAKRSVRRTGWDHETLIPHVVARLADEPGVFFDPDDATLLPYATIGHNVARRLKECISFGAGKVTGLRAIGLDPDEYCSADEAHWSVRLPARQL